MTTTAPIRALTIALTLAVALLVGPTTVIPGLGVECAAAAGEIAVSVVVDAGPSGTDAVCVTVPERATGADVLVERARLLGRAQPRWDGSGLLCAIDGHPTSGCGERTADGYLYWSYWQADTGTWTYSSIGPATRRMKAGSVEGWRFIAGAGNPTDPPPRGSPDHRATCGAPEPPPTSPPPTTATPTPTPTGPTPTSPPPGGGGATPGEGAPGAPSPTSLRPGTPTTGAPADATDTTGSDGTTAGGLVDEDPDEAVEPTSRPDGDNDAGADGDDEELAAALPTSAGSDAGDGPPVGTIVGIVLIAGLGAGAAHRFRRSGSVT